MADSRQNRTQGSLYSFPATSQSSATLSVTVLVHYQGDGRSVWQSDSNRVDWLLSFSKMIDYYQTMSFGGQFSRRRQNPKQSNQSDCSMHCCICHVTTHTLKFRAKIGATPIHTHYSYAYQLWVGLGSSLVPRPRPSCQTVPSRQQEGRGLGTRLAGKQLLFMASLLCVFSLLMCLSYLHTMQLDLVQYL